MALRWARTAASLFVPVTTTPDLLDPDQPRCRLGFHAWLAPEDSIRSARTGYRLAYCRFCADFYAVDRQPATSPAVRFKRAGAPLAG